MTYLRKPETWVVMILLVSYAFFWHARDWNSASRLMLTYSLVDRGTIQLDGLERQTGDIAHFRGHYYSDKLPGYSLLATVPYGVSKLAFGLPDHPREVDGIAYWWSDYWVTLGTSGLMTALCAGLLTALGRAIGCGPRAALLVGLGYGLATPAYPYGTLSYGHQACAFCLLLSFALLWRKAPNRPAFEAFLAGVFAAYASVIELQVGPVSAILGFYLLAQVCLGARKPARLGEFAVGAALPTLILMGYHYLAFGSAWDMGYFHHATEEFQKVHSSDNPLGLQSFNWSHAGPLLWGRYRGLFFYAPLTLLAIPGWAALLVGREWAMAIVSFAIATAVFLVNLSYPEWTGGWSTGPRLLIPLLPFLMLPVARLLAVGGKGTTGFALGLAVWGGTLMFMFQGVGARIPQFVSDPLVEAIIPLWTGGPLPPWWLNERFTRNPVGLGFAKPLKELPAVWQGVQFLPLLIGQAFATTLACLWLKPGAAEPVPVREAGREDVEKGQFSA